MLEPQWGDRKPIMQTYREEKATQAAAKLLSLSPKHKMNHVRLIKLLYLADRQALINWGRTITGDDYYSLRLGPILQCTLDLLNDEINPQAPSYWHKHISERQGNEVRLLGEAPNDQLSSAEENLLQEIFDEHGKKNQWELVKLTHDLPEWQDPGCSRLPISIRRILSSEGFSESEILEIENSISNKQSANDLLT